MNNAISIEGGAHFRPAYLPMVEVPLRATVQGYWIMVAHQADENGEPILGTARHLAEFPNLITNVGLDMLGLGLAYDTVQVGTSSTPPTNADTTLGAKLATTGALQVNTTSYVPGPPTEYGQTLQTYRFGVGVAAGNLTEIGISKGATTPLFSHALILDGTGTPTTITVLSTEILDCTYILRILPPTGDVTGNVVIAGTTYNYTCRPESVGSWNPTGFSIATTPSSNAYDGGLGNRALTPTGNSAGAASVSNALYSNGSTQLSVTAVFGVGVANFANGVKSFDLHSVGLWQFGLNSGGNVPKTSNQTLSVTFNVSWARA